MGIKGIIGSLNPQKKKKKQNHIDEDFVSKFEKKKKKEGNPPFRPLMDSFFLFAETSDRTWPTHGFFPATLNLATNAIISANATCGVGRPEKYCKLVEHVFMTTCDAEHVDTSKRHPISNAIDGTDSWWQSPSLEHGRRYEWVTITVDLKQVYQVAYVILKAANSPRPANWILEGSIDGRSYMPWQYYPGKPKYNNDNEVICTSYYSKLNPLEGGEEFTRARYVRLRFQKIRTLNADLMFIRSDDNPLPTVNQRYFYSVKDISIGGACACYGHARDCPIDKKTSMYKCNCLHNTCGANCNRCCPLYNQKKWEAGTLNDGAMCEKCECHGHAKSCKYDKNVEARKLSINTLGEYNGGGVCINCLDNTMGNNCEHCKDGYYRPISVSIESKRPCRKCDCRFFKGSTGQCVKDDSPKFFQEPGSCICKNNFAGKKCQRCAPGFKNYPFCTPCPCHHAGTRNWSCDLKDCTCKENVEGSRCDKCKAGSYYLNPDNVEGCSKCFCFGVTNKCTSSELSAVTVKQIRGWTVTDLSGDTKVESTLEEGTSRIADDDMLGTEMYYWQAPNDYLGKKIQSYGGNLRFVMGYAKDRGDTSGVFIHDTNVILEGRGMRIGYAGGNFKPGTDNTYIVPLWKHGWYTLNEKGHKIKAVTKAEMMAILYSVDRILIRSKFHTDQIEGILNEVTVDVGSKYAFSKKKMNLVEKCECPPGYSGLSCENCLHGYRKVNRTLFGGECVKCNCNQHAERCDPNTGACIVSNCLHYTTGPQCERCEYGYYGDATRGKPDDCKPCACPSKDPNNFSDTCTAAFSPTGDVIDYTCSNCEIGYMGDKCQRCIDGFFGNPLAPGNFCQPCDCNNNTDPGDIGICDTSSGECLKCIGNTDGWRCELCEDGYYGNALKQNCQGKNLGPIFQLATCNPYGSISAKCDQKTGKCTCRPNFVGDKCDRCAEGFGSMAEGCRPCNCNPVGSLSKSCNPQSGICECKPGVFGTKCDSCLDGYYGFSAQGCQWCGCDPDGANTTYNCDEISGQCVCKDLVVGRACDRCTTGYWGSRSDQGCKPCNCNETGSVSRQCDDSSGKCQCKPGVGGIKCDQCLPGYFGWSFRGCRKCDRCDQPGRLCHPKTGECVCPPNTRGDRCQYCVPRTYGYDRLRGCKPCDCHLQGSVGEGCDAQTGKCKCLAGVEGEKCDQCQYGYYNFPRCRPCNCNIEGTLLSECRSEQLCQCDDRGQCPCKIHTTSRDCGQCKSLTFGLTKKYESGCYDCFCYGKSLSCSQGAFKWRQITLTAGREANFDRTRARTTFSVTNGLKIIPEQTGNIRVEISSILDGPLYWSLPKTFLGDRSLSYNGVLKFKVTSYGRRRFPENSLSKFSLVQIQGNWRLILEYFAEVKSDGYYVDFWQVRGNPHIPVTRGMMMVTLQNVQHFLIRATTIPDPQQAMFSVSLQVAERQSVFPAASNLAVGVEVCQCPQQYVGASCQDPAEGYYRKRKDDFLNSKDILDLVGVAVPCDCNGRSKSCDKETGICYNCHANTTGSHCELCSTGFYGNPDVRPCRPCACPLLSNSFSDTCVQDGNDYYCTNCQPGYTGRYCHKCADGYYGDPGVPGGRCTPCACDQQGSTSAICDHRVGQCVCKEGITGRDCTICKPRYVITKTGCKSCDDDCTGLLLNDIDYFMSILNNTHITGLIPAPWHKLWEYENRTRVFRVYVINDLNMYGIESSDPSVSISRALEEAERILREIQSRKFDPNRDAALRELRKAKSLLERMKKLMFDRNKLDILKEKLSNLRRLIQDLVYQLSENVLPGLLKTLITSTRKVRKQTSMLSRLNPIYRKRYVIPAQKHAADLMRQAAMLAKLFKATQDVSEYPLKAAKVYRTIVDALSDALAAARNASAAAETAHDKAFPAFGDSLVNRASRLKARSRQLLEAAKKLRDKEVPVLHTLYIAYYLLQIRVSLTADSNNKCMRTYRPEMEPSTANKIVVIYGISSSEQDSLLFYVGSKEKDDFMALEMVNRKIRFSWNTGGKLTGTLQHNLTLQTNDVAYSANSKWYKIEVNRYGNIATLSVQPSPQGALTDPNMVSGASAVGYSIIDLDSKSLFLIGGVPTGVNLPPEVKTKSYSGCMYELKIDGRQVGLWNFKSTDGCSGCKEGAAEEADLSSLNFKGMGYLSMPQISDYNAQSYSIALHFKTFDENALLFFSPNVKTGEYVSIELRDGKILYRFKIGKSTNLVLSTKQKYNTGTWTKVIAERSGLQGLLSVQNELLEGKVRSGVASSLDLKGSRLYFGGVPPTFSKINENWKAVSFTSFLGCMKGLQMDTTPLGVLRGQSYDVDPGCKQEMRLDDEPMGTIQLNSEIINAPASGGLYFGGVPQELIADKMVASDIHFKGTIKDAIFNNKIIAFNLPKRFINIGIGRPEITEMKKILVIETSAIEKCADRMKYTWEPLALSFGDTLDSKIQKIVNKKQISTTFTINFDFRTYYPNGMLLLLRNAKRKVFLMIHLLGGKVVVDYKGKTARQLQSQGGLNDGQWHSIKLVKSAQKLELSVDPDGEVMKTRVRKRLYLQPTFYVASFPEYFIQETKSVVTETFKGCIRNFKLNDKFLDLASGKVTNVGQCFSKIEAGSYFGGDAYAIFSKSFEVGLQTQVELEFKTAKLNGIILSVSEPFGSPSLAVELNNGNVSVNVNQGYGMKTFKAIQSFASKYFICDSKWHSVKVEFSKNSVSLRVDKETEQFGFSDVVGNKITTKSPLYIGGIPDYESKGALGVRDNFVGCIKNLAINQRRVDWIDMAGLNNVLPNSCPVN
ncbi:Laminin subunit alpha-1 [Nymphon striatum]|nr:Laminin subunit alpha-1 [Nymphon striatum]